jgi:glycine cleavage system H protein
MSNIPSDLHYTRSHEWVRQVAGGALEVGITEHAQGALGDLVFVEVPDVGRDLNAGDACAVVESVKAASDVYSPVSGDVVGANDAIVDQPALVNESPEDGAWFFKVKLSNTSELDGLMDRAAYDAFVAGQS